MIHAFSVALTIFDPFFMIAQKIIIMTTKYISMLLVSWQKCKEVMCAYIQFHYKCSTAQRELNVAFL
jgi:hypothetical protein